VFYITEYLNARFGLRFQLVNATPDLWV